MSYSPVPESIDVQEPLNYRSALLASLRYLYQHPPTTAQAQNHWLGACADYLSELKRDPQTPDQAWAWCVLLAGELARTIHCTHDHAFDLINQRLMLRDL